MNKIMNMSLLKAFPAALFAIYFIAGCEDARASVTTESTAKFHGDLIIVECTVNNNTKKNVDFGSSVGITRVDGKRYEQTIPFALHCENYAGGDVPELTLKLEGSASSFNNSALVTNVKGLGIEIKNNGTPQPLNKAIKLNYKNIPVLTAVPVADPKVNLSPGGFSATLKLVVEVV